ncbi:MAG: PDZ domain-containing protein [Chloroflexi bacterium]|nr:PDZ domain-containing protein [Chloroflexota bacterium]
MIRHGRRREHGPAVDPTAERSAGCRRALAARPGIRDSPGHRHIAGGAILGFFAGRLYERAQYDPTPVVVVTSQPIEPLRPGPYQSGRLGISYRMLQPGDPFPVAEGALVIRTLDERVPAALAGLPPGDIIIEVDGVPVTSWNALEDTLAGFGAGERVRLVIIRAGEEMSLTAELG